MIKTTEYFNGIISIIEQLNNLYDNFNDSYECHYFDETNSYVVVLESGKTIRIHKIVAQDAELDISNIDNETFDRIFNTCK
ncbi:MAG: hypothetical protein IKD33_05960 [Bacteroidales bacterium]|nr:hypothetical protein [Bacteroidales bacterium]